MTNWKSFISRTCSQTAVYWGNPQDDGDGGKTFDAPVEIKCRWEHTTELIHYKNNDSEEAANTTNMKIITIDPIDLNGYLYLGLLTDLPASPNNPVVIENAFKIQMNVSIPLLNGIDYQYEYLV